jgi:hypothetical protein
VIPKGPALRPHPGANPAPALLGDLLLTLREESRALAEGDLARLATTASRKRHLLRLLTSHHWS